MSPTLDMYKFVKHFGLTDSANTEVRKSHLYQVSSIYRASKDDTAPLTVEIQHSCLVARGHEWKICVQCRATSIHQERKIANSSVWREVTDVIPDAKVEQKHNDVVVTLPQLNEDIEIAAFGIPGTVDQKRMKMAIFGKKPTQGRDWKLKVYLIDDSTTAFEVRPVVIIFGKLPQTRAWGLNLSLSFSCNKRTPTVPFSFLEYKWLLVGNRQVNHGETFSFKGWGNSSTGNSLLQWLMPWDC